MTKRIQRVNALIRREVSQILLREIEFPQGVLVTVTRIETANDLKESNVWISAMPEEKLKRVLEILNKNIYFLQQKLNKRLKMRPLPKIKFLEEKKTAEAGKIEEILSSLNLNKSNSDSPQPSAERLDQIGITKKRRPSPFNKKGCPKGDSVRVKRVPIWEELEKEQK